MDLDLASTATALVAKFLTAVEDDGANAAAALVGNAGHQIVDWIKGRFGERPEYGALEQAPDSTRKAQAFERILEAELTASPDAAAELKQLLAALETQQPAVYQEAQGEGNVLVAGSHNTVTTFVGAGAPNRLGVRWDLAPISKNSYLLENIGDATAYAVTGTAERAVRTAGKIMEGDPQDLEPGDKTQITIHGSWQAQADEVKVIWHEGDADGTERTKVIPLA